MEHTTVFKLKLDRPKGHRKYGSRFLEIKLHGEHLSIRDERHHDGAPLALMERICEVGGVIPRLDQRLRWRSYINSRPGELSEAVQATTRNELLEAINKHVVLVNPDNSPNVALHKGARVALGVGFTIQSSDDIQMRFFYPAVRGTVTSVKSVQVSEYRPGFVRGYTGLRRDSEAPVWN